MVKIIKENLIDILNFTSMGATEERKVKRSSKTWKLMYRFDKE